MYKLTHFRATNVIGFVSGLGRKTFDLDLSKFSDKDILIILGDNATGKSTFLSLVHPWHTPTDGRTKFIVPGKEGTLLRTYTGDDGTVIVSKCIYHPKGDDTHNAKCYLSITRPGEDEIELNSNGNVTSYYDLLYTYFGINKDYINFASYNDSIGSIIRMTDTERKNSIANMVPNTARFDMAFSTINEKYRDMRNSIRNLAQKIVAIRAEDSLKSDIKRVTKDISKIKKDREEKMQAFSLAEGRVKELTHGKEYSDIIAEHQVNIAKLAQYDSTLHTLMRQLHELYDKVDIEYNPDSIVFKGMNKTHEQVVKYEKKIARSESELRNASDKLASLKKSISERENSVSEIENVLFSIQAQDIDELKKLRLQYQRQLSELRYTKHKDQYADMSYDETITLSRNLVVIDQMINALYDEFGDLVSQYFSDIDQWTKNHTKEIQGSKAIVIDGTIETMSAKRDVLYRKIIEREQYSQLQQVLDQRPSACTIDTCPFIVNALKWRTIAGELVDLHRDLDNINILLTDAKQEHDQLYREGSFTESANRVVNYIQSSYPLIDKYLKVSMNDILSSIANGTWSSVLDILKVKQMASILSEKDLYIKLTTRLIPDVERSIQLAEERGTNRELLISQIERYQDEISALSEERDSAQMSAIASTRMLDVYKSRLSVWRSIDELIKEYTDTANRRISTYEIAERTNDELETIQEIVKETKRYDKDIKEAEEALDELEPALSQMQLDLKTLTGLKAEKVKIEMDFLIVDMIRQIIQPGKGLRKELINIYMFDIYQTANELLLNTFNGNLYLREFIITDKEFTIPYVYNGSEGFDVSYASSAQQSIITTALSLAIISKMIDKYGIIAADELDKALAPAHKEVFIDVLTKQARYIGVNQLIMISHSPEYYEPYDVGFIVFPGGKLHGKNLDVIKVD